MRWPAGCNSRLLRTDPENCPRSHVTMVSSTQQSSRIRRRKQSTNGKTNKRERRRFGTPVFPIHVEGYDAKAADAPRVEADKKLIVRES